MVVRLYDTTDFDASAVCVDPQAHCFRYLDPFQKCWYSFSFKTNQIEVIEAYLVQTPEPQTFQTINFDSGCYLALSMNQTLFSRHCGWTTVAELKRGDDVLSIPNLPFYGEGVVKEVEQLVDYTFHYCDLPNLVFTLTEEDTKRFLRGVWEKTGRLYSEKGSLLLLLEHLKFNGLKQKKLCRSLQYLMFKIGVSSRIDPSFNIMIFDDIDKNLFLYETGVTDLLLDVHSPRKWQTIVSMKTPVERQGLQIVTNHPNKNILVNNIFIGAE